MFTLEIGNAPIIVVGFAAWAVATTGVLLGMESMSAVLHALRLHWYGMDGVLLLNFLLFAFVLAFALVLFN